MTLRQAQGREVREDGSEPGGARGHTARILLPEEEEEEEQLWTELERKVG